MPGVSTPKRSAINNLKLAEATKKAKVGATAELESQKLLLSTQNDALIAENALQKIEIATLQAKIAAHEGIFGFVTYWFKISGAPLSPSFPTVVFAS